MYTRQYLLFLLILLPIWGLAEKAPEYHTSVVFDRKQTKSEQITQRKIKKQQKRQRALHKFSNSWLGKRIIKRALRRRQKKHAGKWLVDKSHGTAMGVVLLMKIFLVLVIIAIILAIIL